MIARSAVVVIGLVGTLAGAPAAQAPRVDQVMRRSAAYVAGLLEELSYMLIEERSTQELGPLAYVRGSSIGRTRRVMRSDLLVLRVGGPLEWRQVRDAYEVDGVAVGDREGRLPGLLQGNDGDAKAARLAAESARFNLGPAGRTVNTPILPLLFLQNDIQARFTFRLAGTNGTGLTRRLVVQYSETERPTLIRGVQRDQDVDLPASGRFWIDEQCGCVLKSEIRLAHSGMSLMSTTSLEAGHGTSLPMPVSMTETYDFEYRVGRAPVVYRLTTQSSYSNYRRFRTEIEAAVSAPQ